MEPEQENPQDLSIKSLSHPVGWRRHRPRIIPPPLDLNAKTLAHPPFSYENEDFTSFSNLQLRKRVMVDARCNNHHTKSPKSAGPFSRFPYDQHRNPSTPCSPLGSLLSIFPTSTSFFTHFPPPPSLPPPSPVPAPVPAQTSSMMANIVATATSNGYPTPPLDSPFLWPNIYSPFSFSSIMPNSQLALSSTSLLSPAPSSSTTSSKEDLRRGYTTNGLLTDNQDYCIRKRPDNGITPFCSSENISLSFPTTPLSPKKNWPKLTWQCFMTGSYIKFIIPNIDTPWQTADELAWKDHITNKMDSLNSYQYAPNGLTTIKIESASREASCSPFVDFKHKNDNDYDDDNDNDEDDCDSSKRRHHGSLQVLLIIMIPHKRYTDIIQSSPEIQVECSIDHPFFVKDKGWSSVFPRLSFEKYGIQCHELSVGDICLPRYHPEAIQTPDFCDRFKQFEFSSSDQSKAGPISPPASPAANQQKETEKVTTEPKPKRPMNGFMLYAKKYRLELIQMHPGKDNRAISVLLGESWKALASEERESYSKRAKLMADEKKKMYPDCWKRKQRNGTTNSIQLCAVNSGPTLDTKAPPALSHNIYNMVADHSQN